MSDYSSNAFNIWSHLISAALFSISVVHFTRTHAISFGADEFIIFLYFTAAISCFTFSTIYHTSVSYHPASTWHRIDHLGITAIIWASSISFIHFSFAYQQTMRQTYIALITISAICSMIRLWKSPLDQLGYRTAIFTAFGGLATLPAAHLTYQTYRQSTTEVQSRLLRSFWSLVGINGMGGLVYVADLLQFMGKEASHNAMHVTAAIGAWIYRQGLISTYQLRKP